MKNIYGLLVAFFMFLSLPAFSQCDAEVYTTQALKSLTSGFTFMKTYKIDGKEGTRKKIEYTCVMTKDNSYMMRVASKDGGAANGIIVTLQDAQRTELAVNQFNNKSFNGWTFKCPASGVYYLTFSFKDSQSYCGAAVLGFKITN